MLATQSVCDFRIDHIGVIGGSESGTIIRVAQMRASEQMLCTQKLGRVSGGGAAESAGSNDSTRTLGEEQQQ